MVPVRSTFFTQQRDDPLRLSERISADQMRALRKQSDRIQQFPDFAVRVAMTEDRQAEGRFRDENIAGHDLERRAGRVGRVLVVAGCDDTGSPVRHHDLGRTQHMPRRMEGHGHIPEPDLLAIGNRLCRTGEIIAIAQPHDVERFLRRQNCAVSGAGVIGMAMRNQRALHSPYWIDMKASAFAAEPGGNRLQEGL
jgi:hypothetical protein